MTELPSIASEPISVVLIAHNSAPNLKDIFSTWKNFFESLDQEFEVLLVDDGSSDDTYSLAQNQAETFPQLVPIRLEEKQGFGPALRTGIEQAKYPLLCFCPCDPRFQLKDLKAMLELIDKAHLVCGCRVWKIRPQWLRVAGMIYRGLVNVLLGIPLEYHKCWQGTEGWWRRWLARWIFGVRVHDPESGFCLFRTDFLKPIAIQAKGTFASVELIAKANFLEGMMTEVPVKYRMDNGKELPPPEKPTWRDFYQVLTNPKFVHKTWEV